MFLLISLSSILFMYRNTIEFYTEFWFLKIFLIHLFVLTVLVESLGFSAHSMMLFSDRDSFTFSYMI